MKNAEIRCQKRQDAREFSNRPNSILEGRLGGGKADASAIFVLVWVWANEAIADLLTHCLGEGNYRHVLGGNIADICQNSRLGMRLVGHGSRPPPPNKK